MNSGANGARKKYSSIIQKWQNNVLRVSYQGCNETGFCYPPIKKTLKIIPEKKEIVVF